MQDEPWYVQRRRELEAAAPVKRKKIEPFVKVPLWWITAATKATNNQESQLSRMNCQTFSTGLGSGHFGGSRMMVILAGTRRRVDKCQPA